MLPPELLEIELPPDLVAKIDKFNQDFLKLAMEIAKRDINASVTLGLSEEVAELLATGSIRRVQEVSQCGLILAKLRFNDLKFWTDVFNGKMDNNDVVHRILTEG